MNKKMIKTVCKKNLCTGCCSCAVTCVKQAITITDNIHSFDAVIDETMCVNCHACEKICPQNNPVDKRQPLIWKQGWSNVPIIRQNSSSGGLASAIACEFIKMKGVVVSCLFENGEFCFQAAKTDEEIKNFAGSKYVKSNPVNAYKIVNDEMNAGKKVLFIGLPCQVAGIKRYFNNKNLSDNLYTIDLICHGTPSKDLLKIYLKGKGIELSKLESIKFRTKNRFALWADGKTIAKTGRRDLYTIFFLKKVFYTESCYSCQYATIERCSDLTLGDSWGSNLSGDEINKGISLILCQSHKGKQLIDSTDLCLEEVSLDEAIHSNENLEHPSLAPAGRKKFLSLVMAGKSFDTAARRVFTKIYFKNLLKELL